MERQRPLRALGIGDIIDEAFRLLRNHFAAFVGIAAVVYVPRTIVATLLNLNSPVAFTFPTSATTNTLLTETANFWWIAIVDIILTMIAIVVSDGALSIAIARSYLGQPVTISLAYQGMLRRLRPLVGAILLEIVYVVGLYVLLAAVITAIVAALSAAGAGFVTVIVAFVAIIGGLILFVRIVIGWTLVIQVVMLEDSRAVAAFRRSASLVDGFRWKTLGVLIITYLLLLILVTIPSTLIEAAAGLLHLSATAMTLIDNVTGLIFNVILAPLPLAALTLLFYDLKIRKEAFDLEVLAGQLSSEPPALPY